jgi:hypothetical protein
MTDAQVQVLCYKLGRLLNAARALRDRTLDPRECAACQEVARAVEAALATIVEPVRILVL